MIPSRVCFSRKGTGCTYCVCALRHLRKKLTQLDNNRCIVVYVLCVFVQPGMYLHERYIPKMGGFLLKAFTVIPLTDSTTNVKHVPGETVYYHTPK